jgi:acyl-CoA thioesterase-1
MKSNRVRLSILLNIWLVIILVGVVLYENIPSRVLARISPPTALINTQKTIQLSRLTRLNKKLQGKKPVIIAAFGDSVTQGASSKGFLDPESVYHNQLKKLLENRYPNVTFSVINSGIGGDEATDGLARLDKSVIRFSPDLVIVGFGLNDSVNNGLAGISKFEQTIAQIIKRIKQQTDAEIILLTPNFLATSDNVNIQNEHRQKGWAKKFPRIQNSGILEQYAHAIRLLGSENDIPVADIYSEWKRMSEAIDTNSMLINGLNHPDARGHRIAAETIMTLIDSEYKRDQ